MEVTTTRRQIQRILAAPPVLAAKLQWSAARRVEPLWQRENAQHIAELNACRAVFGISDLRRAGEAKSRAPATCCLSAGCAGTRGR